jgi:hypothetical protein
MPHASKAAAIVLDPTRSTTAADIVQQVRVALAHPPTAGATTEVDHETATMIIQMLDGAPPPVWVWECVSPDGCANRICRLAHLMQRAAAVEAMEAMAPCACNHRGCP